MKRILLLITASVVAIQLRAQEGGLPFRIIGAKVAREYQPGANDPNRVDQEDEFLTTDPAAILIYAYTGGNRGDKIRVEFRDPFGALAQKWDLVHTGLGPNTSQGRSHALPIAGAAASRMSGKWEARIFFNDQGMAIVPFRIAVPANSVVGISNPPVLPRATTTVPYSYQFRAEGGSSPYRWSVVGNPPPGLAFSAGGGLTGVPSRRGSFRMTVRVDDSAGNSLTRSVGLGIGDLPAGPRVTRSAVTRLPSSPDACATPASDVVFSPADLAAWVVFEVEGAAPDDTVRVEWVDPAGDVEPTPITFDRRRDQRRCYEFNLAIAGKNVASRPGTWRFRLFWREGEILNLPFQIADSDAALLPGRHALVVGNGAYRSLPPVPSATGDAGAVAKALRQDGFEVTVAENRTLEEMKRAESEFVAKLRRGDVVVFYFSGYGFQLNGDNWLAAANYDPASQTANANAYSVERLRQVLEGKEVRLAMIVLDAAREQARLTVRSAGAGLARMKPDAHTILVYAVPPGRGEKVAADSKPDPFARAFANAIGTASAGVQQLLLTELPKAAAAAASGRPAPVTLVETSEEFVFRMPAAVRQPEFVSPDAAERLSGVWEFGRAEGGPGQPAKPLCKVTLSLNRGPFGNRIENGCTDRELFWRLEGDRLHLIGMMGMVTSVLRKTGDDSWKGPYFLPDGTVNYLKRPGGEVGTETSGVPQDRPLNQAPPGFTALFNGKDFSGWRGRQPDLDPRAEAAFTKEELARRLAQWNGERDRHWRVDAEKGELITDGQMPRPNLATVQEYGDFELYVDWLMIRHNSDSGIYLRGYPQVQIWDPDDPVAQRMGGGRGSGGLFNNNPGNPGKWPLVRADNPVGQWNTYHIQMVGSRVWIWLNGKLTVDGQLLDNSFNRGAPLVPRGPIELQSWTSEFHFRNIYVREIAP